MDPEILLALNAGDVSSKIRQSYLSPALKSTCDATFAPQAAPAGSLLFLCTAEEPGQAPVPTQAHRTLHGDKKNPHKHKILTRERAPECPPSGRLQDSKGIKDARREGQKAPMRHQRA